MDFWTWIKKFLFFVSKNEKVEVSVSEGGTAQVPVQVYLGQWVAKFLKAAGFDFQEQITKLKTVELGYTRTIEELEGRVNELEVENQELKTRLDYLIDDVNDGDAELNQRIDSILRVDQILTALGTRADHRILVQESSVVPTVPTQAVQLIPPAPQQPLEPAAAVADIPVAEPAQVEVQPPVEPASAAEPEISDNKVREMCQQAITKYHLTYSPAILDAMIKKVVESFQRRERLVLDIDAYFGMASRTFKEVVKQLNISKDLIHTNTKWKLLELAAKYEFKDVIKAIEEMRNFLANQPVSVASAADQTRREEARREITSIANDVGLTHENAGDDLFRLINDFTQQLSEAEAQETEEVKNAARTTFIAIKNSLEGGN